MIFHPINSLLSGFLHDVPPIPFTSLKLILHVVPHFLSLSSVWFSMIFHPPLSLLCIDSPWYSTLVPSLLPNCPFLLFYRNHSPRNSSLLVMSSWLCYSSFYYFCQKSVIILSFKPPSPKCHIISPGFQMIKTRNTFFIIKWYILLRKVWRSTSDISTGSSREILLCVKSSDEREIVIRIDLTWS